MVLFHLEKPHFSEEKKRETGIRKVVFPSEKDLGTVMRTNDLSSLLRINFPGLSFICPYEDSLRDRAGKLKRTKF